MAIKGKRRSRGHPVSRAPRRAPVDVPIPFVRRRWVQVVAAGLLGAGLVVFAVWLTNGLRAEREEARLADEQVDQRRAIQSWQQLVESELAKVGQLGPAGAPPQIATELEPTLDAIADGETDGAQATLEALVERLGPGADALEGFELASAIRSQGLDAFESNTLTASQTQLAAGLRGLVDAADTALLALEVDDEQLREDLIDRARAIRQRALVVVQDGWRQYGLGLSVVGLTPGSTAAPTAGGIDIPGLP